MQNSTKRKSKQKVLSINDSTAKILSQSSNQHLIEHFSGWEIKDVMEDFLFTNLDNTGNL